MAEGAPVTRHPVTWTPPRRVTHPALAVPCGQCGAEIGRHCTAAYASGAPREPHRMRREVAGAHGFVWAPGAMPPSEAAYLAAEQAKPQAADDQQPSMF